MNESIFDDIFSKHLPFWSGLGAAEREVLLHASQAVRFKAGETVHDGNECTGVIIVKSGSLRVYMLSEDGKEVTLYRLFAGEISILSASCVLDAITFDVVIDAEEDTECVIIGGCAYEEVARKVAQVRIYTLEEALSRFSDVMWVMQQILFMSMDKRLAIFLLDESAKLGTDTIHLTHEQIAKYIGSAREVVSRMLKYFSSEGLISSSRQEGVRILNKSGLRRLAL